MHNKTNPSQQNLIIHLLFTKNMLLLKIKYALSEKFEYYQTYLIDYYSPFGLF